MRNLKNLLLASALSLAVASPALAQGSFSGNANGGFTGSLNGTTGSGSESFGSIGSTNGAGGYASAAASSFELGGDVTVAAPNFTASANGAETGFSESGSASPNSTFTSTADAYTQNTTNFAETDYANADVNFSGGF